jgi:hypothetical protein
VEQRQYNPTNGGTEPSDSPTVQDVAETPALGKVKPAKRCLTDAGYVAIHRKRIAAALAAKREAHRSAP